VNVIQFDNRPSEISKFLTSFEWVKADSAKKIAGDASFRSYYRVNTKFGNETVVLMDAPPEKEEITPFINIAEYLISVGISAPRIIGSDEKNGFVLLEDLGINTFTKILDVQSALEAKGTPKEEIKATEEYLYALAIESLAYLHKMALQFPPPANIEEYSNQKLINEANLLPEWYMPAVLGEDTSVELKDEYEQIWQKILNAAPTVPQSLVLRDYHVDNLLALVRRDSVQACGMLDFQDAVIGSTVYDVMSLMEDARRDIEPELIEKMRGHYLYCVKSIPELKMNEEDFDTMWNILGAIRHAKVIGIFTRLNIRDGKPLYLEHIPRVWKLFEKSLNHPALAEMKNWVDNNIPKNKRTIPKD
jgi:aminoglycoside/choline kinase family phosphotransferase